MLFSASLIKWRANFHNLNFHYFHRPAPSITWKKNGVALQHGRDSMEIPQAFQGRQLIIVNVRRDFHEDQYSCEAENAQGSAAPKTTTLTVEGMRNVNYTLYPSQKC